MTTLTRLLALLALLLVAVPAGANSEVNQPCTQTNYPIVTMGEGFSGDVDTPAGVLGLGDSVSGGTYRIDLAGEPVGTSKNVDVLVTWSNGVFDEVTDYDMVVNGTTFNSSETSEAASLSLGHCKTVSIDEIYSYIGTPADTITVDVSISSFSF